MSRYLTERAQLVRRAMDRGIAAIADDPAAVNESAAMLRDWAPGTAEAPVEHAAGQVLRHGGAPYKCVQAHTHRGEPGYEPSPDSALWMQYHGTSPETARPYYMRDASTVYMAGEYMIWTDGQVYRCAQDRAAYSPDALPGAWEVVESGEGRV